MTTMAPMAATDQTHVPVHEAKAKFSEILRRAGDGEEIVVTRHGQPIARITAPAEREPTREEWIASLLELRKRGATIQATREEIAQWIHEGRRY